MALRLRLLLDLPLSPRELSHVCGNRQFWLVRREEVGGGLAEDAAEELAKAERSYGNRGCHAVDW